MTVCFPYYKPFCRWRYSASSVRVHSHRNENARDTSRPCLLNIRSSIDARLGKWWPQSVRLYHVKLNYGTSKYMSIPRHFRITSINPSKKCSIKPRYVFPIHVRMWTASTDSKFSPARRRKTQTSELGPSLLLPSKKARKINASQKSISWEPKISVYGSLEGNSRNMSHINLWLLSNTKMHDSKEKMVAFTLKIEM